MDRKPNKNPLDMKEHTTFWKRIDKWKSWTLQVLCLLVVLPLQAQVDHLVVSQVYGGGGNPGSAFTNDFVEIYNPTGTAVDLTGYSIQYAAPGNTTGFGSVLPLSGIVQPSSYFLVQLAGGVNGAALPTPDQSSTTFNMGTVGGKLILVNTTTPVSGSGCPQPPQIVDMISWGTANCAEGGNAASAHSNGTSTRRNSPCVDTDNNGADFSTANPPTPQNSAVSPLYCYPVELVITDISPASPTAGEGFDVTIEAHNAGGNMQGVISNTTISLTTNGNAGPISGTITGMIEEGNSSVVIENVILSTAGTGVTITATATSGQTGLTPDTSDPFTVQGGANTTVHFSPASTTIGEYEGSVGITVYIANPDPTNATSVDVALTSGTSSRIGGFTSQTLIFPAGSTDPQTIMLTVVDDQTCQGSEIFTFGLENVSGGMGTAGVGSPSTTTITMLDDDQMNGVMLARQYFDGSGSDSWTIAAGAANISTNNGPADTPPSQRILSAPASWQVIDGTATLELSTIFPNEWDNMIVRARVASLSGTAFNGADATDRISFSVNIDGAGFPATPDVEILGFNNARWGYTATGVASTTAGTPAVFQPSSGGLINDGFSYVEIHIPDGAQSIALRVEAVNNATAEIWAVDNIEIEGSACAQTFYSEANGDIDDPIWSPFPGGTPGPALINNAASIVVQNGFTVTNNSNTEVHDVFIETGGTLDLASGFALAMYGDTLDVQGDLVANESVLAFVGSGPVSITGAAPIDLFDVIANSPAGITVQADLLVRGTLQLVQGEFNASAAEVTLVSNVDGTGRLGPVSPIASYTGDMTVQRYIPGGETNWRLLGSPVGGTTIAGWMDDFITAGFPGSHFPEFFDPPNSGIYWPSIRRYVEAIADPDPQEGLIGVESAQTLLEEGRGFAAWSGDSLGGTTPFVIDLSGPPNIALTPIELPMSWTDSGNPDADGLNLVSNPLPSAIDFTAVERGSDVQNVYYIYDPSTGNNLAWANGFGQGAANGIIQSSQGFWLKADGPDATASVDEDAKAEDLDGGVFGGLEQPAVPMLTLRISSAINSFSDESLIVFDQGTPAHDPFDAVKFVYGHPEAPQIATRSSDGTDMQIDLYGAYTTAISIPVTVQVAISGTYTIEAELLGMNGLSCVSLEDLSTGTITPLNEGATYSFAIDAEDDWDSPRFMLHASAPIGFDAHDVSCNTAADGTAQVEITGDPVDITWTDVFGTVIQQQNDVSGTITLNDLAPGSYMITVGNSGTVCGDLIHEFTITEPFALEASVVNMMNAVCGDAEGSIEVMPMGGNGPYEYAWSNGDDTAIMTALPGDYSVTITDANGCSWTSDPLSIEVAEEAPLAEFTVEGGEFLVQVPVAFSNESVNADEYSWDFGDGSTSTEIDPEHIYTSPGVFEVTLTVSAEGCTSTHTETIEIQTGTSIDTIEGVELNVWAQHDRFIIEHGLSDGMVLIDILDATGRTHAQHNFPGSAGRIVLPAESLSSGIWFVRIAHGGEQATFRVPLLR